MAKPLFSFEVLVEKEVEKTETKTENGQEITVKSKSIEKVPVNIVLKRPARRENDELRLFYGEQLSKAIERGLLTKAILINKHIDGAGALLSKETAKRISNLYEKIEALKYDLVKLGITEDSEDKKKKQEDYLLELMDSQRELQAIESSSQAVFSNTAEAYAQERSNMWLILNQTYIDQNGRHEAFFKGKTFLEKEDSCFDLEESDDKLFNAAREKLALYWGMYSLNRANSPEDFKLLEEELNKQTSEASEEPKKEKTETEV